MRREKLKLVVGQPLVVELEDLGVEKTSQIYDGVDYKYAVFHKGASYDLYLKVDAHRAVKRSGAQIGDEIELSKKMVEGAPVYSVRRFSDAYLAIDNPPPARAAQPAPATNPPGVRMMAPQQQRVAAPAPPAPIATVHPLQELMTRCLEVGYYANQNAFLNLRAQGIEIDPPTWEDVRATGTSLFIERNKREGSR